MTPVASRPATPASPVFELFNTALTGFHQGALLVQSGLPQDVVTIEGEEIQPLAIHGPRQRVIRTGFAERPIERHTTPARLSAEDGVPVRSAQQMLAPPIYVPPVAETRASIEPARLVSPTAPVPAPVVFTIPQVEAPASRQELAARAVYERVVFGETEPVLETPQAAAAEQVRKPTLEMVRAVIAKKIDATPEGEPTLVGKSFSEFTDPGDIAVIEAIETDPETFELALTVLYEFVDLRVSNHDDLLRTAVKIGDDDLAVVDEAHVETDAIKHALIIDIPVLLKPEGRTSVKNLLDALRPLELDEAFSIQFLEHPVHTITYVDQIDRQDILSFLIDNLVDGPARDQFMALVEGKIRAVIERYDPTFVDVRGRQRLADTDPTNVVASDEYSPDRVDASSSSSATSDHGAGQQSQ